MIEIPVKIRMQKKNEGSNWFCVNNGEFHFSSPFESLNFYCAYLTVFLKNPQLYLYWHAIKECTYSEQKLVDLSIVNYCLHPIQPAHDKNLFGATKTSISIGFSMK